MTDDRQTTSFMAWPWVLIATATAGRVAWKLGTLDDWWPILFEAFKVMAMFMTLWILSDVRRESLMRLEDERDRRQVRWLTALGSVGMALGCFASDLPFLQVLSHR